MNIPHWLPVPETGAGALVGKVGGGGRGGQGARGRLVPRVLIPPQHAERWLQDDIVVSLFHDLPTQASCNCHHRRGRRVFHYRLPGANAQRRTDQRCRGHVCICFQWLWQFPSPSPCPETAPSRLEGRAPFLWRLCAEAGVLWCGLWYGFGMVLWYGYGMVPWKFRLIYGHGANAAWLQTHHVVQECARR